jgi:hypothetical protein
MAEVTLAAANVRIAYHDKAANLRRFLELIDEAGAVGADVLVLPEMGLQGYADFAFGIGDGGAAAITCPTATAGASPPGPSASWPRNSWPS